MSVEHAKAFIERMKTDEVFREQIMAIETPEERLKAIVAAGFECTAGEINEAGREENQFDPDGFTWRLGDVRGGSGGIWNW